MRKMIITRGLPGAGKSTLLRKLGLDAYALSADQLRLILKAPIMMSDGHMSFDQNLNERVWPMLKDLAEERMDRGELIVFDATHFHPSEARYAFDLAEKHGYEVALLDLTTVPFDLAKERNAARPAHQRVPDFRLERIASELQKPLIDEADRHITWSADGTHVKDLDSFLKTPIHDLSAYDRVHHLGDLQGCLTPVTGPGGYLEDGFKDSDYYIFVGDYIDRGIENGEVMRWLLDDVVGRPNVTLLGGNHETHLEGWLRGRDPVSEEFAKRTLPQLEAAGIAPEDIHPLIDSIEDAFFYDWRGSRVMACHAGLADLPERPAFISTEQWRKGTGYYQDPVDQRFSENAPEGWYQVHGHRNSLRLPIQAGERSFNLESQVEFGGQFRALSLDENGFHGHAVTNQVFRPMAEHVRNSGLRRYPLYPSWMLEIDGPPQFEAEVVATLRNHPLVRERVSESRPHISAFNFTKDAFHNAAWDDVNTTARGLFLNNQTHEPVIRGYDKFFNVGERKETKLESLAKTLAFPVTLYVKENGYLGLQGYDRTDGALLFASKSSLESDFAGWFREIFDAQVPAEKREWLRRYLRDTQTAATYEVIDPVRDPHMIEYDRPKVVLLDILRRQRQFERLPYKQLSKVGKLLGVEVKQKALTFRDYKQLQGFLAAAEKPDFKFYGKHLEGFVIEDARGYQTKWKSPYYAHWKRMRGLKDRIYRLDRQLRQEGKPGLNELLAAQDKAAQADSIAKALSHGLALSPEDAERRLQKAGYPLTTFLRDNNDPRAKAFTLWAVQQPGQALGRDIISLRKSFEAKKPLALTEKEKKAQQALFDGRPAKAEDPEITGYRRALEGVERSSERNAIKPATAAHLLRQARDDERKAALLHKSAIREKIVTAAPADQTREVMAGRLKVRPKAKNEARERPGGLEILTTGGAREETPEGKKKVRRGYER